MRNCTCDSMAGPMNCPVHGARQPFSDGGPWFARPCSCVPKGAALVDMDDAQAGGTYFRALVLAVASGWTAAEIPKVAVGGQINPATASQNICNLAAAILAEVERRERGA